VKLSRSRELEAERNTENKDLSRTLLIVKPDATERNLIGHIINRLERAQFRVVEMKMVRLSADDARRFYAVHEGKPFAFRKFFLN